MLFGINAPGAIRNKRLLNSGYPDTQLVSYYYISYYVT